MVVMASWLALFCLFGFRATFAVLKVPMGNEMHWSAANISAGYSLYDDYLRRHRIPERNNN